MVQSSRFVTATVYQCSLQQHKRRIQCGARGDDREARRQARAPGAQKPKAKFGILADVDPNAPLLKPIVGNTDDDYTVRSKDRFKSDFIWNTNWQDQAGVMVVQAKMQDSKQQEVASGSSEKKKEDSGFLSFSRVADLDDMNIDLSKQLMEPRKPRVPTRSAASTVPLSPAGSSQYYAVPPTSAEVKSWARSSGYRSRNASAAQLGDDATSEEARAEAAREATEAFDESKREYQLWTAATAVVCAGLAYSFYTREIAASYIVGALGGIVYLRLLGRGVDSVAASSIGEAAGGALGQQRLLIPVILVLFYNRYNTLYSDQMGLHLELLPMLIGFFTYKAGVVGKTSLALFRELSGGGKEKS